eukprot:scaffold101253_cov22-Prasinocladus_malaysianus.AAC.1
MGNAKALSIMWASALQIRPSCSSSWIIHRSSAAYISKYVTVSVAVLVRVAKTRHFSSRPFPSGSCYSYLLQRETRRLIP